MNVGKRHLKTKKYILYPKINECASILPARSLPQAEPWHTQMHLHRVGPQSMRFWHTHTHSIYIWKCVSHFTLGFYIFGGPLIIWHPPNWRDYKYEVLNWYGVSLLEDRERSQTVIISSFRRFYRKIELKMYNKCLVSTALSIVRRNYYGFICLLVEIGFRILKWFVSSVFNCDIDVIVRTDWRVFWYDVIDGQSCYCKRTLLHRH